MCITMFRNLTQLISHSILCMTVMLGTTSLVHGQELNWAEKMLERREYDFKFVARGADASYRLKVTNIYKETMNIAGVRTSCGCISAQAAENRILAGESTYIDLKMDTIRYSKQRNATVTVTFSMEGPAPAYQEVVIPIKGYIRTDVVLSPGGAEFGAIEQGVPHERHINISYAGQANWKIDKVTCRNTNIVTDLKEVSRSPSGEVNYDLTITLKESAPKGDLRERLVIHTSDGREGEIPLLVEAKVEPEFKITPENIYLGTLAPGQMKQINIVVNGRRAFKIDKLESDSGSAAFQMRLPKSANVVNVLQLIVTAPSKAGPLSENFTLTISGNPTPLQFKATGKVESATASATN